MSFTAQMEDLPVYQPARSLSAQQWLPTPWLPKCHRLPCLYHRRRWPRHHHCQLESPGHLGHEIPIQPGQAGIGQGETDLHISHAILVVTEEPSFELQRVLVVDNHLLSGLIESGEKHLLEIARVLRSHQGQLILDHLLCLLDLQHALLRLLGLVGSNLFGVLPSLQCTCRSLRSVQLGRFTRLVDATSLTNREDCSNSLAVGRKSKNEK